MPIHSIQPTDVFAMPDLPKAAGAEPKGIHSGFAELLDKSVGEVNDLLRAADKKMDQLAVGKVENLHEAMIAFEKAESALKLLMQVRNKALEAYHQVLQMQI